MSEWPSSVYQTAERFVLKQVALYGTNMEREECCQEAWIALLEAQKSYHRVQGCCNFTVYATNQVRSALQNMRQRRNARFTIESSFSLDKPANETGHTAESTGLRYAHQNTTDCANLIALKDYINQQGRQKSRILWHLYHQADAAEIMESEDLTLAEYQQLLQELQSSFKIWQEI